MLQEEEEEEDPGRGGRGEVPWDDDAKEPAAAVL